MRNRVISESCRTKNLLLEQLVKARLGTATVSEPGSADSLLKPVSYDRSNEIQRAGFHVIPWCKAVGFSRATLYKLKADHWPKKVRIGRRLIIIEAPDAYLKRIAALSDQAV